MSIFGTFLEESYDYMEEAAKDSIFKFGDQSINYTFFGDNYNLSIKIGKSDFEEKEIEKMINSVIKISKSKSLYSYLYNINKDKIEELNEVIDSRDKPVKNGNDLIKSMQPQSIVLKRNTVYIVGSYYLDNEHGYSISFPNGKFIKSKSDKKTSTQLLDAANAY